MGWTPLVHEEPALWAHCSKGLAMDDWNVDTIKASTTRGSGMDANLISVLGTIFSFFGVVLQLRRERKKVSDKLKLDLLSASAALIAELGFCKDVHHHFHSFTAGPYKEFLSRTERDLGDRGVLFQLQSNNISTEDRRLEWRELFKRFESEWRLVKGYRARMMSQVLTRASNTTAVEIGNANWEVPLPGNTRENAELLVIDFQEMLQSIDDFRGMFDNITEATCTGNRDQIMTVPKLLIDFGDKAEKVITHADGAIMASVAILDEVNRVLFLWR
jgi:hypothetical protein